MGRWLLGQSGYDGLLNVAPEFELDREIGVIAGTSPWGIGRMFCRLPEPNDGTVTVAETELPQATECINMKSTHTGLLFSFEVAEKVCFFLKNGYFEAEQQGV